MNTPASHNPYQPPKADVTPPVSDSTDDWISGGQTVSPGNAFLWIGGGWKLFAQAPGISILNCIIFGVLIVVVSFIPIINIIVPTLLLPVFVGGIMLGWKALDSGDSLQVDHVFAGFKERFGQLMLVGLLTWVTAVALIIIGVILVAVVLGGVFWQAMSYSAAMTAVLGEQGVLLLVLIVLIVIGLTLPLAMATWFAPALVVFHNLSATRAMKHSFLGCARNILPYILYGVAMLVLTVVACIPAFLGLLVLAPIAYGSIYYSYKDIYVNRS
jgi:hypothetical protein